MGFDDLWLSDLELGLSPLAALGPVPSAQWVLSEALFSVWLVCVGPMGL